MQIKAKTSQNFDIVPWWLSQARHNACTACLVKLLTTQEPTTYRRHLAMASSNPHVNFLSAPLDTRSDALLPPPPPLQNPSFRHPHIFLQNITHTLHLIIHPMMMLRSMTRFPPVGASGLHAKRGAATDKSKPTDGRTAWMCESARGRAVEAGNNARHARGDGGREGRGICVYRARAY